MNSRELKTVLLVQRQTNFFLSIWVRYGERAEKKERKKKGPANKWHDNKNKETNERTFNDDCDLIYPQHSSTISLTIWYSIVTHLILPNHFIYWKSQFSTQTHTQADTHSMIPLEICCLSTFLSVKINEKPFKSYERVKQYHVLNFYRACAELIRRYFGYFDTRKWFSGNFFGKFSVTKYVILTVYIGFYEDFFHLFKENWMKTTWNIQA